MRFVDQPVPVKALILEMAIFLPLVLHGITVTNPHPMMLWPTYHLLVKSPVMVICCVKFVFCSAILYYLFWDFWHDGGRFLSGLHGESDVIVCMTDWQPAKLLFRHRQLQGWRIISTRDSMSTHRNLAKSILCNPNKIKAFSGFCSAIMPEDPYFYTLKTPAVYPEWKIFL